MNRDAEAYNLPTTYDRILVTRSSSTSRDHMPDEVRHWRMKMANETSQLGTYILRLVVLYEYDYRPLFLLLKLLWLVASFFFRSSWSCHVRFHIDLYFLI